VLSFTYRDNLGLVTRAFRILECLYLDMKDHICLELDEKIHRSFVNLFLSDIACMDCVGYMVTSQDWSPPLLIAQIEEGGYTLSVCLFASEEHALLGIGHTMCTYVNK
jgi:hypothetical protein